MKGGSLTHLAFAEINNKKGEIRGGMVE